MASSAESLVVAMGGSPDEDLSLVDILDHVLHQGVLIRGNIIISLAGVDLVYVGLDLLLTSVETALRHIAPAMSAGAAAAAAPHTPAAQQAARMAAAKSS